MEISSHQDRGFPWLKAGQAKWLTAAPRPQPCMWGRGIDKKREIRLPTPWRLRFLCNLAPIPFGRGWWSNSQHHHQSWRCKLPEQTYLFFPTYLTRRDLFPGLSKIPGLSKTSQHLEKADSEKGDPDGEKEDADGPDDVEDGPFDNSPCQLNPADMTPNVNHYANISASRGKFLSRLATSLASLFSCLRDGRRPCPARCIAGCLSL